MEHLFRSLEDVADFSQGCSMPDDGHYTVPLETMVPLEASSSGFSFDFHILTSFEYQPAVTRNGESYYPRDHSLHFLKMGQRIVCHSVP